MQYAVNLLKKLVVVPTINPPRQKYGDIVKLLSIELESVGLSVEVVEIPEEYLDKVYPYTPKHRGNKRFVVLARSARGNASLHINGHYDVVPPGRGWTRDPFRLVVEGERLYGRGTTDMKGGIAAVIAAIKKTIEEGKLREPIELAFVPDEESGGIGTRYLIEELGLAPRHVLIAEPTNSERIAIGHKGVVRGVVKVIGRQGHAARPWMAVNAFEEASKIVSCLLKELPRNLGLRESRYPFLEEEARRTTVSLGGYAESSSMKDNMIPGEFTFSFDMRTIPEDNNESVFSTFKEVLSACAARSSARVEIAKLIDIPPASTPTQSPLIRYVKNIAKSVIGQEPKLFINTGRNDLVFYRKKGSHVVVYGPGITGQAHAVNEYTTLSELRKFIEIYSTILENLRTLKN